MIYLNLLLSFIKIGLFNFGGGYAMIPLIQREIESNGWITSAEFIDIIAIAEMTPGPIAVNTATYVGYKTAGIAGGLFATLGVSLPSLLIVMFISGFFFKYRKDPVYLSIFYGIRPVITALIASAAIFFAEASLLKVRLSVEALKILFNSPLKILDIAAVLIMVAAFFAVRKLKIHPVLVILGSGAVGAILYFTGIW